MREKCMQLGLVSCPYRLSFCARSVNLGSCDKEDCDGCSSNDEKLVKCSSNPCQFSLEQKLDKLTTELKILNTNKV